MKAQWFVLDLNPEPWAVGPLGVIRKNNAFRPFIGRNQQVYDYQQAVAQAVRDQNPTLITGKVRLTLIFWRRQEEYQTSQARTHRKHEADCTNMQKATEDALQGICYKNDKDNNEVHAYIAAQGPNIKPRIVICVEPGDEVPDIINHLPAHVYDAMDRLNRPELFQEPDWYINGEKDPNVFF